jgi:DNA repair protein RadC
VNGIRSSAEEEGLPVAADSSRKERTAGERTDKARLSGQNGAGGGVAALAPAACAVEASLSLVLTVLGPGSQQAADSLALALKRLGLVCLSRAAARTLAQETALPAADCARLEAAFELGRCVEQVRWTQGDSVRTSSGVYRLMAPKLRGVERETFHVLLLDGRHRLLASERISEGTLTTSLVHPREVFRPAIRASAAAIVVVHNHPSGDPEPSRQDLDVTRRLAECGRLVGIPLLDHVVIGHGAHVSIRERIEF